MTNESVEVVMHVRKNNPTRTIAALGCCCCGCAIMVVSDGRQWNFLENTGHDSQLEVGICDPGEHVTIHQYTSSIPVSEYGRRLQSVQSDVPKTTLLLLTNM